MHPLALVIIAIYTAGMLYMLNSLGMMPVMIANFHHLTGY